MMHLIVAAHWTNEDPDRHTRRVARKLGRRALGGSGAVKSFTGADVDELLKTALRTLDLHETANYDPRVEE